MRSTRIKRALCSFAAWLSLVENTYAQTAPGFTFNQVPTTLQWNSYFAGKVDNPAVFGRANTWTNAQTFGQIVNFGLTGVITGSACLKGSTSGSICFQAQANAGTYNWIFPTTVGAQGTVLETQGGTSGLVWGQVPYSQMSGFAQSVNLNSVADTQINLSLPTTNYIMEGVWIENTGTLASLAAGSFSLCTLALAGGTCVAPVGTSMSGAVNTGINKANNAMVFVIDKSYWNVTAWFFRVNNAAGAGAQGTVLISTHPLPIGLP